MTQVHIDRGARRRAATDAGTGVSMLERTR